MNLYVVRHGETIWNVEHKVQGITDIPLTDKGRYEATSLSKFTTTADKEIASSLQSMFNSDLAPKTTYNILRRSHT